MRESSTPGARGSGSPSRRTPSPCPVPWTLPTKCTAHRAKCSQHQMVRFKLSVSMTSHAHLLEIEGLFTQGWRRGRTFGESVCGFPKMDGSNWSHGVRCHGFHTRPNTEFDSRKRQFEQFLAGPTRALSRSSTSSVSRRIMDSCFLGKVLAIGRPARFSDTRSPSPSIRGLHSSAFQLNVSIFCEIRNV